MLWLNQHKLHLPLWSAYALAFVLGLAFFGLIVSISWHRALATNESAFSLQSAGLKDKIFSNIRIVHNTVDSFASFFDIHPVLSQHEFDIITAPILQKHAYINEIFYAKLQVNEDAAEGRFILDRNLTLAELSELSQTACQFIVSRQNFRQQTMFSIGEDIFNKAIYQDIIKTVLSTDDVAAMVIEQEDDSDKYLLLKTVRQSAPADLKAVGRQVNGDGELLGLVGILVDPAGLLGIIPHQLHTTLIMVNDSYNAGGRKKLYHDMAETGMGERWAAATFSERGVAQFPIYSISMNIDKDVLWSEIDKLPIYISLLIGIGVMLLIIALVRVKDSQAQELKARNLLIQSKVEEQTRELALARDKALEASRIKSDFLASMSHEIRTPLNAIIGMSTLLEESKLTDEKSKYVEVFKNAGDTLLNLVNDILDLSKIEAHQLELEKIEFDVAGVVEEAIDIYALKAEEKGIELLSLVTTDIKRKREGDPARLKQVILNLISNALKFTEQGEIVVYVSHQADHHDEDQLKFSVSDTGIGIPADKCETIFSSFSQADSSITRKYGGTGLGLAICRNLIEMMRGKIQVESEEGKGSVFSFTAHLPVLASGDERGDSFASFMGNKALIAHYNSTSINILSDYLSNYSIETVAINSAVELKSQLAAGTVAQDYDIIMLNSRLADTDLFSFLQQTDITGISHKTILMLHAAELNHHIQAIKNLSVASYLVKPIKQLEMLRHIAYILLGKQGSLPFVVNQDEKIDEDKPLNILLVEDNPDNRLLFNAYLKKYPYTIDEAENGEIAINKFTQGAYDLVFMDVQMPVMDGHTATRQIRQWEAEQNRSPTVIIALTAHAIREEIDKCMAAGCSSHLSKPVKKQVLLQAIKTHL